MTKFRPLEKVRSIVRDSFGLDIMYAYDDLVFAEHGIFLIQFDQAKENNLHCFLNKDFDLESHQLKMDKLEKASRAMGFTIQIQGRFAMDQIGEEIKIEFTNQKEIS